MCSQCIPTTEVARCLGADAAAILGYEDSFPAYHPGISGSYHVYQPKGVKMYTGAKPKYGHGPSMPRIVIDPRGIHMFHPDYMINVFVDSTYVNWYVYSEGNISQVEKKLLQLMRGDGPWKDIRKPWEKDLIRRQALTRHRWEGPKQSPSSQPDDQEPVSDLSTRTSIRKPPTFGDLSLLSKQSAKKS